jgi:hypothetical protein
MTLYRQGFSEILKDFICALTHYMASRFRTHKEYYLRGYKECSKFYERQDLVHARGYCRGYEDASNGMRAVYCQDELKEMARSKYAN